MVAGRTTPVERPPHERRHQSVRRGRLLDRELEQVSVVGGRERVVEPRVDLPVRGVVLLVDAYERQTERADVVLHLPDHALRIDPPVEPVDRGRVRLVEGDAALGRSPQEVELELVPDRHLEPALACRGDGALQHPARIGLERLTAEEAVAEADRRVPLPRQHPKRREVGTDLHVTEAHLVAQPRAVRHDARVVDRHHGDAEVDAVGAELLEEIERDDLRARHPEEIRVVDPDPVDARLGKLVDASSHRACRADLRPRTAGRDRGGGSADPAPRAGKLLLDQLGLAIDLGERHGLEDRAQAPVGVQVVEQGERGRIARKINQR